MSAANKSPQCLLILEKDVNNHKMSEESTCLKKEGRRGWAWNKLLSNNAAEMVEGDLAVWKEALCGTRQQAIKSSNKSIEQISEQI